MPWRLASVGAAVILLVTPAIAQETAGARAGLLPQGSWFGVPGMLSANPEPARATIPSVYNRRQGMIRVLGELYLRARCDQHRRSRETWAACAEAAERMGCPPGFCQVMREMSREDLSARQRARLTQVLAGECEQARIDEVNLRSWVELLALPPQEIRVAMETLPLGNLFWRSPEVAASGQARAPLARSDEMGGKLLGLMEEQLDVLRSVTDTATAGEAAQAILQMQLQLQILREECAHSGMTLAGVAFTPLQIQLYESLRQGIRQEWERLRSAGYFDSPSLIAIEALLATS